MFLDQCRPARMRARPRDATKARQWADSHKRYTCGCTRTCLAPTSSYRTGNTNTYTEYVSAKSLRRKNARHPVTQDLRYDVFFKFVAHEQGAQQTHVTDMLAGRPAPVKVRLRMRQGTTGSVDAGASCAGGRTAADHTQRVLKRVHLWLHPGICSAAHLKTGACVGVCSERRHCAHDS